MNRVLIQQGAASEIFAALRSEWRHLFAAVGCSPFLSWEWMSVWFENFGENKTPHVFKVYRNDDLIGILPMYLEKKTILGIRFNRLLLMGKGSVGADYLDLIARPGDKSDALSAIFEFLQSESLCDLIQFDNLWAESDTVGLLNEVGRMKDNRLTRRSESITAVCPQINLARGWDGVLARIRRSSEFKRKLKKLEKMNGFEYRSITSPEETAGAFERFLPLHEKRWVKAGGSELSGHPRLVAFQRQLVSELSRVGMIRFDELWVEGECRSSVYGLDDGETFYQYSSGYDGEYSHLSVGLVLLGLSIKNAIGRGNTVYDFLRGDETYKFDWADRSANLVTVSLGRNTFPVIAREGIGNALIRLRDVSKYALPSGMTETVGNLRRAWKRNYQLSDR